MDKRIHRSACPYTHPEFGYAKDIIQARGASVELLSTWRTNDQNLISLWDEVRKKDVCINEKLALLGPYTTDIGPEVLQQEMADDDDERAQMRSIIPFQLAYAVSIHKAQGLEYDSVKIIIPSNNAERITHGIFYTAITCAKNTSKSTAALKH